MKIAVRYHTQTGNTKKLAEAIAGALGTEALTTEAPITEPVDLPFLGSSVYAAGVAQEIRDFLGSLDPALVGSIVSFSTAALLPSSYKQISKLCAQRGLTLDPEEFHCRGQFHALHKGKPDSMDEARCAAFAVRMAGAESGEVD